MPPEVKHVSIPYQDPHSKRVKRDWIVSMLVQEETGRAVKVVRFSEEDQAAAFSIKEREKLGR